MERASRASSRRASEPALPATSRPVPRALSFSYFLSSFLLCVLNSLSTLSVQENTMATDPYLALDVAGLPPRCMDPPSPRLLASSMLDSRRSRVPLLP